MKKNLLIFIIIILILILIIFDKYKSIEGFDYKKKILAITKKAEIPKNYILAKPFYKISELDDRYKYYNNLQKLKYQVSKEKYFPFNKYYFNDKKNQIIKELNENKNENENKNKNEILAYNDVNNPKYANKKLNIKNINMYTKPLNWKCQRLYRICYGNYNLTKYS